MQCLKILGLQIVTWYGEGQGFFYGTLFSSKIVTETQISQVDTHY